MRRSVRALKPLAVEERSGTGALAALVRSFEGMRPSVAFDVEGEERELPPDVELVLYRVLQEGLTNVLRHSGARRVEASLAFHAEGVKLSVSDDGDGAPNEKREEGFGVLTLKEQTELLGGVLSVGNSFVGGFDLQVELPVEKS